MQQKNNKILSTINMAVFKFSIIKPLKLNIFKNEFYHMKAASFEMIITEKTIAPAITKPELRWFERTPTFYANGVITDCANL